MIVKVELECTSRAAYTALLGMLARWMNAWKIAKVTDLEVMPSAEDTD